MTDVDRCKREPDKAGRYDVGISKHVERPAAETNARLAHISTDAVFDGMGRNYTIDDAPNHTNIYAQAKLNAESEVQQIHDDSVVT
jgi:dTDP-4-dehydrorhamnose reductase